MRKNNIYQRENKLNLTIKKILTIHEQTNFHKSRKKLGIPLGTGK